MERSPQEREGGGEVALNKVLYGEAQPEGLYPSFVIEKVPLSFTFLIKLYPFDIPTERLIPDILNFSLEKPPKILG